MSGMAFEIEPKAGGAGCQCPYGLNICNHFSSPIELSMSDMSSLDTLQPALASEG